MSNLTPISARLEIDLDQEYLRMHNEWFFKWHFIGDDKTIEIEKFNGTPIRYSGMVYSGSCRLVYWDTIQRYLKQKVGTTFDSVENQLNKYPIDIKERILLEVKILIIEFADKIRRTAIDKDRILRGNGIEFPPPQDEGTWIGSQKKDIELRTATLMEIYCEPKINIEGNEVSLQSMMKDKVTLVKKDGTISRENISAVVTANKVITSTTDIQIEVGDHLLRHLPNGLVEDFIVVNPVYYNGAGSIPATYQVVVRRSGEPAASSQTVINHFTGNNARMYMNSTDNSVNIIGTISKDELNNFLMQVKQGLPALPQEKQTDIQNCLSVLEEETASAEPSNSKIRSALTSIKTICEGVTGNLVAAGVVEIIKKMAGM